MKKQKEEEVPKQARRVVTTLLPLPTAEDQAAAGFKQAVETKAHPINFRSFQDHHIFPKENK